MSRRNILTLAKYHLRHFSRKATDSPWEIVPKQWRRAPYSQPDEDSLVSYFSPSLQTKNLARKVNVRDTFLSKRREGITADDQDEETLQEILKNEKEAQGNSVASAKYLVFNGASVLFSGYPDWITPADGTIETMPAVSELSNYIVGVDMSDLPMSYTTLRGVRSLHKVSFLRVSSCPNFDDWCLDHVTGNFLGLEILEIRFCPLITAKGLGTLYRLRNLRLLKLEGLKTDPELELMCILLEEHFKDLKIEGISYSVDKLANEDDVKQTSEN